MRIQRDLVDERRRRRSARPQRAAGARARPRRASRRAVRAAPRRRGPGRDRAGAMHQTIAASARLSAPAAWIVPGRPRRSIKHEPAREHADRRAEAVGEIEHGERPAAAARDAGGVARRSSAGTWSRAAPTAAGSARRRGAISRRPRRRRSRSAGRIASIRGVGRRDEHRMEDERGDPDHRFDDRVAAQQVP